MITRKRWLKTWADMRWQYERRALTPFERTVMLEWHQNNPDHKSDDPDCEWCKQEREDEAENNPAPIPQHGAVCYCWSCNERTV